MRSPNLRNILTFAELMRKRLNPSLPNPPQLLPPVTKNI